jgi:hypothetical protein
VNRGIFVRLTCSPCDGINSTFDGKSAANDRGRLHPVCIVFPRRTGPGSGCPLSMFLNTPLGLAVSVLRSGGRSLDCVQLNFQFRLRCVDLAMSSHLCIPVVFVFRIPSCFSYKQIFTCAAGDYGCRLIFKRGRSFFFLLSNIPTPLKYKPAASVRYQNNDYNNYTLLIRL